MRVGVTPATCVLPKINKNKGQERLVKGSSDKTLSSGTQKKKEKSKVPGTRDQHGVIATSYIVSFS